MAPRVTDWPQRLLPMPSPLCTMILYLLFLVLILGNVSSQTANMTEEELIKVEGNQTFRESITNNTTIKPGNLTSNLYKDKTSLIEDELQNNNITLVEDNEHFQDKENQFQGKHCNEHLLVMSIHSICGDDFHKEMMSISTENWCVLENIIRPYDKMAVCLEILSVLVHCYYPNPNTQDFFLSIHSNYFHNCSKEEPSFVDAPQEVVIALTLIPVSIIPVLVYLVIWKSSVQE